MGRRAIRHGVNPTWLVSDLHDDACDADGTMSKSVKALISDVFDQTLQIRDGQNKGLS